MSSSIRTLAAMLLLASCGGGDSAPPTSPPPPPPPPPAVVAASIAISAGDGQVGEPNTLVAIAPTVVVRSASGIAVPNVTVTFAVDSGGGSVGTSSATTDANGIASAGSWRLGSTESPQVLTAAVATIAPVRIRAMSRIVDRPVVTQSVPATGGTLTVNRAGSPLHGATLQLDRDALLAATSITLIETSTRAAVLPAGMQVLSPGLGIAGDVGELHAAALITLPATPVAGQTLMIAVMNPATGAIAVLPTVSSDANSITALLPALDSRSTSAATAPGAMAGTRSSASQQSAPQSSEELKSITFMIGINEELLEGPVDTGFRPGADDWDFKPLIVAALPFLTLAQDSVAGEVAVAADGLVSTALWYFANRRKQGGPPLNGSTQEARGVPLSSRRGIRWAALAEANVPSFNQVGSLAVLEWTDFFTEDRARFARLQFLAIKALMLTTERPTPVVLLGVDNPDEFNEQTAPLAIAYKAEGNTLFLAIQHEPGREFQVSFTEAGMAPFSVQRPNGTPLQVHAVAGVHYINVVNNARLAEQWARVSNGTIGNAEGWPTSTLHWEKARLDTARIYLLDTLQHWWQCATCPERVPTPAQLPASASHVMRAQFGKFAGSQLRALTAESFSSMRLAAEGTFEGEQKLQKVGSVIFHPLFQDSQVGRAEGWLDYISTTYRKLELVPSVDSINFSEDTTVTVTVTPSEAPPTGTRYRWLLRTEDDQDSVETTSPTHTRELEAGTNGWLVISALEGEHKRPIARDSVEIKSEEAAAYWRITSIADSDNLFGDEEIGTSGEIAELFRRLLAAPQSGVLAVEQTTGGATELRLRVLKSSVWNADLCCPLPPFSAATEHLQRFGSTPPVQVSLGAYFAGWGTSAWSQTTTDLSAGTMTGQFIPGTQSYRIKDLGTQVGPAGGLRILATRNGLQITGTIGITIWWTDDESGEIEQAPETYLLPFTGTRMQ